MQVLSWSINFQPDFIVNHLRLVICSIPMLIVVTICKNNIQIWERQHVELLLILLKKIHFINLCISWLIVTYCHFKTINIYIYHSFFIRAFICLFFKWVEHDGCCVCFFVYYLFSFSPFPLTRSYWSYIETVVSVMWQYL